MSESTSTEKRLAALETEVAELKRRVAMEKAPGDWIGRVTGSFQEEPEFDKVLRLGREIRQSRHPDDNS